MASKVDILDGSNAFNANQVLRYQRPRNRQDCLTQQGRLAKARVMIRRLSHSSQEFDEIVAMLGIPEIAQEINDVLASIKA